jgi:hypothetical protein
VFKSWLCVISSIGGAVFMIPMLILSSHWASFTMMLFSFAFAEAWLGPTIAIVQVGQSGGRREEGGGRRREEGGGRREEGGGRREEEGESLFPVNFLTFLGLGAPKDEEHCNDCILFECRRWLTCSRHRTYPRLFFFCSQPPVLIPQENLKSDFRHELFFVQVSCC